jgi:hypothetical protein
MNIRFLRAILIVCLVAGASCSTEQGRPADPLQLLKTSDGTKKSVAALDSCVRSQGFRPPPAALQRSADAADVPSMISSHPELGVYRGSGFVWTRVNRTRIEALVRTPLEHYRQSLSGTDLTVFDRIWSENVTQEGEEVSGGCVEVAARMAQESPGVSSLRSELQKYVDSRSKSALRTLDAEWSRCMKRMGHAASRPGDEFRILSIAVSALDLLNARDIDRAFVLDEDITNAARRCLDPQREERAQLATRLEHEFYEIHKAEVDTLVTNSS